MVFYRRKLPHWVPEDKALFVTWRLHGSLPEEARERQESSRLLQPFPSDDFLACDLQLDQAKRGPLWLKEPRIAGIIEEALHHGETVQKLYALWAYVVMPNHVHVLLTAGGSLERVTKTLKGYTARQANKILGRTGHRFWQAESYDHWVRSEEEFSRIVAYIEHNPVSAGLVQRPEDWPWSSAGK